MSMTTNAANFERPAPRAIKPLAVSAILFILSVLSIAIGTVAIGSGLGLIPLPFEMFKLAERLPYLFHAHMLSAAMALLLLPAVLIARHRPEIHRPFGRLLGVFVVIGGLTALPVAILSHSSFAARAGFFAQGVVWLVLFAAAWRAIRARQIARHVILMLAMAAVTTGAIWFRLIIGTAIALRLPFEPAYAVASWAGWLVPLALIYANRGALTRAFLTRAPLRGAPRRPLVPETRFV